MTKTMDKTAALYKPGETSKSSSSSQKKTTAQTNFRFPTKEDGVRFPKSKQHAIELRELGTRISLSKDMLNNIVVYHQTIGADKDLPTGKADLFGYLNRFHLQLAVLNPHWPGEMNFGFVYGAFFNAVIYGTVELKGFNTKEHIRAFRTWITQAGVLDNLERAWYENNPKPKRLSNEITETKEDKEVQAQGYVNFSPKVVKEQIGTLEMIYGSYEAVIKSFEGSENYIARLYNTRKRMKEEGTWG